MRDKKIILAGGSGFIGQELTRYFGKENDIVILTRNLKNTVNNRNKYDTLTKEDFMRTKLVKWNGASEGEWITELNGADILINLAGKTVNCRYNKKNKKEIIDSRVNAVKILGTAIDKCKKPPLLWINASSATIYRDAMDRPQDEYNGEFHDDFSVQVCKLWERFFFEQSTPGTRKVALRMAITLGSGGVLIPYFNLIKLGLGGKQGSGKQKFSWIHIEDTCRMIEWIYEHPDIAGVYNCSSPNPVSNQEFMRLLRNETHAAVGLPASTWMLKIGASIIGTETELILKSRWVLPTKILETGFQFKFPLLDEAFKDIVNKVPHKQYRLF